MAVVITNYYNLLYDRQENIALTYKLFLSSL